MNTIGDGKPAGIRSYSHAAVKQANHEKQHKTQNPPPETCSHEPDGWEFDDEHHAFLISTCEHCGRQLLATEIDDELLKTTGELSVEEYEEDPK